MGTLALALLLAGSLGAQAQSSRKSMEFDVVPAEPRQPPADSTQTPADATAPTAPAPAPQAAPVPAVTTQGALPPAGASQATAPQTVAPQAIAPQAAAPQSPAPQTQAQDATAAPGTAPSPAAGTQPAAPTLPSVQAGLLECRGEFATGYGFGSTRKVTCEFRPSVGVVQYYVGKLDRVGLDIGISDQASLLWGVLATSRDLKPGALAGRYVGITSGIALGPGFSANMLASEDATRQITLQPVSVSSDSGLSLSIAGATLTLEPSATRPR